jgi:oligopeptide transport system ATP-binding protein
MRETALEIRHLVTRFHTESGVVRAVNGVSWRLGHGETLAIVGESGSGKTVSALSVMGLLPQPPASIEDGAVILGGRNLLEADSAEWQKVRGREIAMVFQDPMTCLNPVLTVGYQLTEGMRRHLGYGRSEARDRAEETLRLVGIPDPSDRLSSYPHQLSGGQRQRIMIGMALSCEPKVLIADEPTTALDVTIQAQIVDLVRELQARLGMSIVWITHDLALVAGLAHRVAVMYAGSIVEEAPVESLFAAPRHPYTQGLLRSIPSPSSGEGDRLQAIKGSPPDLTSLPEGCPFAPRCRHALEKCRGGALHRESVAPGHATACWRWRELGVGS